MEVFLAASATVTKTVDFIRNAVDPGAAAPKWIWNLTAFGLGIAAAFAGGLNLLSGDFGTVITGLAIGAAGSGFHEVFDWFSSRASR